MTEPLSVGSVAIGANLFSVLVGVVLLFSMMQRHGEKDRKTRYYLHLLIAGTLSCAVDAASWMIDKHVTNIALMTAINTAALISGMTLSVLFSFYLTELIRDSRKDFPYVFACALSSFGVAGILMVILGGFLGKTLLITTDHVAKPGPWYNIGSYVSMLTLLVLLVLATVVRKSLGKRNLFVVYCYVLIPLMGSVVELIPPYIEISLPTCMVSILILYVLIQAKQYAELDIRQKVLEKYSYTDPLTMLPNRRAYVRFSETLTDASQITVVFCDLNGLKLTNDRFGHAAGDRRLQQFAELLKETFSNDHIFRISGDEFIIIGTSENQAFDATVDSFVKETERLDDIAATGFAKGAGRDVGNLVKQAEALMYTHKDECLLRHPEYERDAVSKKE